MDAFVRRNPRDVPEVNRRLFWRLDVIRQAIDLLGPYRIRNNHGFDEMALGTFEGSLFGMIGPRDDARQIHSRATSDAGRPLDRRKQYVCE